MSMIEHDPYSLVYLLQSTCYNQRHFEKLAQAFSACPLRDNKMTEVVAKGSFCGNLELRQDFKPAYNVETGLQFVEHSVKSRKHFSPSPDSNTNTHTSDVPRPYYENIRQN